jgi:mannose-1-phosphate guanylyltransferase/phosphomannomutase
MQAIIICGGKGTRLKNIIKNKPKSNIVIDKIPNIIDQIYKLRKNNVRDILLLTNHYEEEIKKIIIKFKIKNCKIIKDSNYFGTGGALIGAIKFLKNEFIVLYSDIYFNLNIKNFINKSKKKKIYANVVIHANDHPHDSDAVNIDSRNKITKIFLKNTKYPRLNFCIAGMFYFKKKFFSRLDIKKKNIEITKDILMNVPKNNIFAFQTIEYLKDFGTPERLQKVKYDVKKKFDTFLVFDKKKPAIFLDRDGVLNKDFGSSINSLKKFQIIPSIGKAIKKINDAKIPCFVVSNQPGLAKKILTTHQLKKMIFKLNFFLSNYKAYIDDYLFCPNYKNSYFNDKNVNIYCSKPKPNIQMLRLLEKKYNLDLSKSYFIGDSDIDILTGFRSGTKKILVLSKRIFKYKFPVIPDFIFNDLKDAVNWILRKKYE